MEVKKLDCERCDAKGYLEAFKHIKGGVCYACGGAKHVWKMVKVETPAKSQQAAPKAKEITVNGEQCQVWPHGSMLQITGERGCLWIDWEAAKGGIIKVEGISDGWRRFKDTVIRDVTAQIKPIR